MTNFELFLRAMVAGAGFTAGAIGVVFVGLMLSVIIGVILGEKK